MATREDKLTELVKRLWERHNEECDKALEALNQGDNTDKFEFHRGSASTILLVIHDLHDLFPELSSP